MTYRTPPVTSSTLAVALMAIDHDAIRSEARNTLDVWHGPDFEALVAAESVRQAKEWLATEAFGIGWIEPDDTHELYDEAFADFDDAVTALALLEFEHPACRAIFQGGRRVARHPGREVRGAAPETVYPEVSPLETHP